MLKTAAFWDVLIVLMMQALVRPDYTAQHPRRQVIFILDE
jgi:hypothetical protein